MNSRFVKRPFTDTSIKDCSVNIRDEQNYRKLRECVPDVKKELNSKLIPNDAKEELLNSFARASLNDVPAILLFEQIYGSSVLKKLGVKLISSSEICLTPQNIVRLNASHFCPVAFTLTNLRLLCQMTRKEWRTIIKSKVFLQEMKYVFDFFLRIV